MTFDDRDEEDGNDVVDIDAAARFRQILQNKSQETFDPLHQSLMDLLHAGELYGIRDMMDYDDDLSDLDLEIF